MSGVAVQPPVRLFQMLPLEYQTALFGAFDTIVRNFRENRWEPAELNGGKLCEIVYCILEAQGSGKYASPPNKPHSMQHACNALEKLDATKHPRSVRIQIPRMQIGRAHV